MKTKSVKTTKKSAAKTKSQPKMKIAVLSFGNLMKRSKGIVTADGWKKNGPKLPVEFCRIAKAGHLALAISENNGVLNKSFYAQSNKKTLNDAIPEIAAREGISEELLGVVDVKNERANEKASNTPAVTKEIVAWAKKNKFDAVIFNGLSQKFKDKINVPFSVGAAVNYVNGLSGKTRKLAEDYIKGIPKEIQTPFRTVWNEM